MSIEYDWFCGEMADHILEEGMNDEDLEEQVEVEDDDFDEDDEDDEEDDE